MRRPVIFLDLDDTLFFSVRRHTPGPDAQVGAVDREGRPNSYVTDEQLALFEWLSANGELVPTTGRGEDALHRVAFPFDSWAICAHGAIVLQPGGGIDPDWATLMQEGYQASAQSMQSLNESVRSFYEDQGIDVRIRLVPAGDIWAYLCIKHNQRQLTELYRVIPWLREHLPEGWHLHVNGNNISVMPPHVHKKGAVEWLISRVFEDRLRLGIGDSLSDVPFMASCHFAVLPSDSQAFGYLQKADDDVQWKL
jgi:hydroxymethylpyrimidine pyrophosphatase-like HAD family hydrolase